jgi:hypothetical protein
MGMTKACTGGACIRVRLLATSLTHFDAEALGPDDENVQLDQLGHAAGRKEEGTWGRGM